MNVQANTSEFNDKNAPSANPVFYRTYSRRNAEGSRESWLEVCDRTLKGLLELGNLTEDEAALLYKMQVQQKTLPSGRWLWVGGTNWLQAPENKPGVYNCSSTTVDSWEAFGHMMELAMMGCGTGAILEDWAIAQLPTIQNRISLRVMCEFGDVPKGKRIEHTVLKGGLDGVEILVGDSRQGWVDAYQMFLELSTEDDVIDHEIKVSIDLSNVRPPGEKLKGFGGTSNPVKLRDMWQKLANILNGANGRQLTAVECCLLIDEAALVVVAGNVRRSAGLRQFSQDDDEAAEVKLGLWTQNAEGDWVVDPVKDALRMANHTRVFHHKPTLDECVAAVTKQYYSGEGAIQWAGEAVRRSSADLWQSESQAIGFLKMYGDRTQAKNYIKAAYARRYGQPCSEFEAEDRMRRYGLNPCFRGDTLIRTISDKPEVEDIAIKDLVGKTVKVYDGEGWVECDNFRVTAENQEVFTITTHDGHTITATAYHNFWVKLSPSERAKIPLNHLKVGDRLERCWPTEDNKYWYSTITSIESAGVEEKVYCCTIPSTSSIMLANGILTGNCGEIIMQNNFCNLSEIHLNMLDPWNLDEQREAFKAGAIDVAVLLHHQFTQERYQRSREMDPIVGVSFTGLFDFFVHLFGSDWLRWWAAGRPDEWHSKDLDVVATLDVAVELSNRLGEPGDVLAALEASTTSDAHIMKSIEALYLKWWSKVVHQEVWNYCDRHGLKHPNRCATCQPAGTKSLLTGASSGWHPPKAQRFIRRITFGKDDPVALACLDYGYSVVPGQSDKDDEGKLLNDPNDPRCTTWLVEIPTEVSWANIPGADTVDISQFSALAQFDFYMQVQRHYTTHNTSATLEMREHEIQPLAQAIHKAIEDDEGYISSAILARFDDHETFPRLPFEPIGKETYDRLQAEVLERRKGDDFNALLAQYDAGVERDSSEQGPMACDSDKCLL